MPLSSKQIIGERIEQINVHYRVLGAGTEPALSRAGGGAARPAAAATLTRVTSTRVPDYKCSCCLILFVQKHYIMYVV